MIFLPNFPVLMPNYLTNKWTFTPINKNPGNTYCKLYLMIQKLLKENNYLINIIADYDFYYS